MNKFFRIIVLFLSVSLLFGCSEDVSNQNEMRSLSQDFESDTEMEESIESNDTEKYIINNFLENYNEIAEIKIPIDLLNDIKNVGRPLSKICITFENGVYAIINHNDFNHILFIDYQLDSNNDSDIFIIIRDITLTLEENILEEEFKDFWENLKSGKYSNYYGEKAKIGNFEYTYSVNVLLDGIKRYSVKSSYFLQ